MESLYNITQIKGETSILQFLKDSVRHSASTKPGQQPYIRGLTECCSPDRIFRRDLNLPADFLFSQPPDAPLALEEYFEKLGAMMEEMHNLSRNRTDIASEKMRTDTMQEQRDTTFLKAAQCVYGIRNVKKDSLRRCKPIGRRGADSEITTFKTKSKILQKANPAS
ncbi:hypothetical protein TNCV_3981061 [Trichonephila clavipes]|nr:hypothetical protein TNCV_3981061 [Trichonephila clavipes]